VAESKDSLSNFAGRTSSKWRRFDPSILPMHVAEMDFDVAKEIRNHIVQMTQNSDLGYLGPIPELAPAFSSYAKSRWNWDLGQNPVRLATDVGVAAVEILRLTTKPGDRVLICSPVYSSFFLWLKETKVLPHDVPLRLVGQRWQLDLEGIEKAFQSGVNVFLMCSPQNPVGTVHTKEELTTVALLAEKYGALVISDEIHAPLSWTQYTPFLTLGSAAENHGVTITSTSKAWNTAGLKSAIVVSQSEKIDSVLIDFPESMHWRASILGAFSMVIAYQQCSYWIDETVERIKENLTFLRFELEKQLPKAKFFDMSATYLAWLDLSAYGVDNVQSRLLYDAKVALVAGSDHSSDGKYSDFVRFNFATSQTRIAEAVRRMASVLEV
jgi:cystathionine beta-lyase